MLRHNYFGVLTNETIKQQGNGISICSVYAIHYLFKKHLLVHFVPLSCDTIFEEKKIKKQIVHIKYGCNKLI